MSQPNELPNRSCQRRFCTRVGPFTDQPIAVRRGDEESLVVGWCDLCAIRICSRCAIHSASSISQDLIQLACLYCGERLGIGEDVLLASEISSTQQPTDQRSIELCKFLAKRGALPTSGFVEARRAILADDPNRASTLLRAEHQLCTTAGHTYGAVCCQIEEGLVLVAQNANSRRAFSLLKEVENDVPDLPSQGLRLRYLVGYLSTLRSTGAGAKERLRIARALDEVATELGIEPGVRLAIDEIVKAQLEMGDIAAAVKTIRRLPDADEILRKLGLSDIDEPDNDWSN